MVEEEDAMAKSRKNAKRGSIMGFLAGLALDDEEDEEVVAAADKAQAAKRSSKRSSFARRFSFGRRGSTAGRNNDVDPDDGPRSEAAHWEEQQKKGLRISRVASKQAAASQLSNRGGQASSRSGANGGQLSHRGNAGGDGGGQLSNSGGIGSSQQRSLGPGPMRANPDALGERTSGRRTRSNPGSAEPSPEEAAWMKVQTEPKILAEVSRGRAQKTRI